MKNPASKKPVHDEIARLAYEFYERDGRADGKDLEYWFRAEAHLTGTLGQGTTAAPEKFKGSKPGAVRPRNTPWFTR